jgi:uncharacterized membrane protein YeaQ/YmgE (transglycosylase-associated protein family)
VEDFPGFLAFVSPAWFLVALIGAFWTGIATVVVPPRSAQFPRILAGALIGAAIGQVLGGTLGPGLPTVGDVHAATVSIGALVALGIVRLFAA